MVTEHIIAEHTKAIDTAHQKIRGLDEATIELSLCRDDHDRRIDVLEHEARENHKVQISNKVTLEHVLATSSATHDLVEKHINAGLLADAERSKTWLLRYEDVTRRWIKLTATVGAVLIILVMILHAIEGKPVLGWLPEILGGAQQ